MDKRLLTRSLPAGREGFTLVEVLISLIVTMTAFLAILSMFNTAFRTFYASHRLTVATNLANSKMADFKTLTVTQIVAQNPKNDVQNIGGVQYTRSWTVSNIDVDSDGTDDLVGDMVKVALVVDWVYEGRPHSVAMSTLTTGKPQ